MGSYILKISARDSSGNEKTKEIPIITELQQTAYDEVVIEETVTNADDSTAVKTSIKKKCKAPANSNKVVSNNTNNNSNLSSDEDSKPKPHSHIAVGTSGKLMNSYGAVNSVWESTMSS